MLLASSADAQTVFGYSVSESQGTYVPLTGATLLFDGSNTDIDPDDFGDYVITPSGLQDEDDSEDGYSLGFTINYCGNTYTDFLVATSGYVYLGNGEIEYDPYIQCNLMRYGEDHELIGFGCQKGVQFDEDTKISYKAADGKLVVQFEHYLLMNTYWEDGVPVDIQLVITSDGTVSYIFSNFSNLADADSTTPFQLYLALRDVDDYVCAGGELGSISVTRNENSQLELDENTPDGTTVTWNPPVPCVIPATQPTELMLSVSSDEIKGEFMPSPDADSYLVLYIPAGNNPGAPVDGYTYKAGDELGESGVVVKFGPDTDFTIKDLPGSTSYDVYVYAANSFGLNGPKYQTHDPLMSTAVTLPAPAKEVKVTASTLNTITLNVTSNDADDDVVVLYTDYCGRSVYGDHGLFGVPAADAAAGDVLPAPEDYEPYFDMENAPVPQNSGVVAYVGKAGEITISDINASTPYYIEVLTRTADGKYTSEPLYSGWSTVIENPYEGDTYNFPRYTLPLGWTGSEQSDNTYAFRDEDFWNSSTQSARQGTQPIQQRMQVMNGDAENGKSGWMVLPQINVNDRHMMVTAEYCITQSISRFQYVAYNEWAENDVLQLLVSEDGENWNVLSEYNAAKHPEQEEIYSYVSITGDLSDYRGKNVYLKYYWNTYGTGFFGLNMYVDRISVTQAEFPDVPEVTVSDIKHDSAIVTWISTQTDYELSYVKAGSNEAEVVKVEGTKTYTLTGLDALTEYTVIVRGLLVDGEGAPAGYSEWSDPVSFTTADYPAVDAPVNLAADVDTYKADGKVVLTWDAISVATEYEVAYRLASSTEWVYAKVTEATLSLSGLEEGAEYIWKVRAYCTHDRVTEYSAQSTFTMPKVDGIRGVVADDAAICVVYDLAGRVITTAPRTEITRALKAGVYVIKTAESVEKIIVR